MALIKCPDCEKEVSDAAPYCPNCGRPIAAIPAPVPSVQRTVVETKRKGGAFEAVGFILIVIGIGGCIVGGGWGGAFMFIGFVIFLIGRFM